VAIDTAAKRASAIGVGLPFLRMVIPDGTIGQEDRQTIAFCYGGILASAGAAETIAIVSTITQAVALALTINQAPSVTSAITQTLSVDSPI